MLENGSDLHVASVRRYNTIAFGLLKNNNKKKKKCQMVIFYFARHERKLRCYSDVIHSVFKMLDSVPSVRYSSVCNVLCVWRTLLIPTYSLPTL